MHIAASPATQYVSEDEIPQEAKDAELRVFEQQAADKPEHIRPKIAEGKLKAWMKDVVLLNQLHVNADKYEGKTIEELRATLSGTTGENVVIRRFAASRWARDSRPRPRLQAGPDQVVGRGPHGPARLRHRPGDRRVDRRPAQDGARSRRRDRGRARRGQHLPRPLGRGGGHGPRHRRLHGHAGDRAQRADAAGRAREARRAHARAVGDHDLRGRRALHPPARDAPPREGPDRHLRRRHRQPVLHLRHRGRAARDRDARGSAADGQERRRRASTRPTRTRIRPPSSSPRSPRARRCSATSR